MRLTVDRSWDGALAAPHECVEWDLSVDGEMLSVAVRAHDHGDSQPAVSRGSTDRLWEFEVVELFIAGPGTAYTELEFGPHGHYLVLRLDGVRRVISMHHPIDYAVQRDGAQWSGRARIPLALLPERPWRLNAYAIHGAAPRRYLVATPMATDQPDFHRPESFCITWDGLASA